MPSPRLTSTLALALGLMAAAAPLSAANPDRERATAAPAGTAQTRYCMRVGPLTGSRLEQVECWTRAQWWAQGVDVNQDWPEEGVRTIG